LWHITSDEKPALMPVQGSNVYWKAQ
jgi:hypothetical protein